MSLVTSLNSIPVTNQGPRGDSRSSSPLPPTSSPNDFHVLNIDAGSNHYPQNSDWSNIACKMGRVSQDTACMVAGTYASSILCHLIGSFVTSSRPYDQNTMYNQFIGTAACAAAATVPLTAASCKGDDSYRVMSGAVLTLMLLTEFLQYSLGVLITERGDFSQENQDEMKTILYGQLMFIGGPVSLYVSCYIIALICECLITARDYAHTCFKRRDNSEVSRRGDELHSVIQMRDVNDPEINAGSLSSL